MNDQPTISTLVETYRAILDLVAANGHQLERLKISDDSFSIVVEPSLKRDPS